eukprot:323760-Pelagomonas_calceolata.AAC.4
MPMHICTGHARFLACTLNEKLLCETTKPGAQSMLPNLVAWGAAISINQDHTNPSLEPPGPHASAA